MSFFGVIIRNELGGGGVELIFIKLGTGSYGPKFALALTIGNSRTTYTREAAITVLRQPMVQKPTPHEV